jgi:hypothetical protein
MAATEEALEDAAWKPTSFEQRETTVDLTDFDSRDKKLMETRVCA